MSSRDDHARPSLASHLDLSTLGWRSTLWRWLEEILAYTVGYGRVREWSTIFKSVSFPTRYGYVYWIMAGSDLDFAVRQGRGIVPEGAGLLASGLMIGVQMQLWFKPRARAPRKPGGVQDRQPIQPGAPGAAPGIRPAPTGVGGAVR